MKKIIKLFSTLPLLLTSIVPATTLVSCNKTQETKTDKYFWLTETVINEFKNITRYPHSSDKFLYEVPGKSNVQLLSNYLKIRVKQITNIDATQDIYGNIWFDVPANDESLKNNPTIALQAHMDMVFAFDKSQYPVEPDPTTTIIDLVEEVKDGKRLLHSRDYKTSIGGDNGIGVAVILAIISNTEFKHGKLRCIFTNCEENAMQGAKMMVEGHKYDDGRPELIPTKPHILKDVKYLINLDGGVSGGIPIACSGAVGSHYSGTYVSQNVSLPNSFTLSVKGFDGGHSAGAPRNYKGNALKLVTEVLAATGKNFELSEISTDALVYNVVPSTASITFATNATQQELESAYATVAKHHTNGTGGYMLFKDMGNVTHEINSANISKVIATSYSEDVIGVQMDLLYGMDKTLEDQGFKTSANIGPATLKLNNDGKFEYKLSTYSRSDSDDRVNQFKTQNMTIAANHSLTYLCDAQFHPWLEDSNQSLTKLVKESFVNVGIDPAKISTSKGHGGIEPAWWAYAMKNIEGISDGACTAMGVNVSNEHKPTETIDCSTIPTCLKAVQYIFNNANKLA